MRLAKVSGQRSTSPGPLMLTHIVRHIFRTARPTNFNLGTRMEDDDPHQPQAGPSRSKVKVTRPINADSHRPPYLPNAKAYELQTWYTHGGRRATSAVGAMTSKVKDQGSKVTSSRHWPDAVPVLLEPGGDIPCRPNPAATFFVLYVSRKCRIAPKELGYLT